MTTIQTSRRAARPVSRIACAVLGLLAAASPLPALAQQAVYPVVADQAADPLLANLAIPANAAQAGMWSRVFDTPIVSIHASVLPDGRILTFGAAPGGNVQDGRTLVFWDPRKGVGGNAFQIVPNVQNVDSFCASATLMPDGRLLASGGASREGPFSSRESMSLDWKTSAPVRDFDLAAPRWYGTMIKLPDGRAIITGGGAPYANADPNRPDAAPDISSTPEIYTPGHGWHSLVGAYSTDAFGAKNARWWYPRQWVSPTGSVFGISTEKMWEMQTGGNGSIRTISNFKTAADNNTRPNVGPTSTAVMFDTGKIIQVGGNGYYNGYPTNSSAAATVFDITAIGNGRVTTSETAPMANPRQWGNATVLPTGKVLVTGGSRYADDAGGNAVLASETWDPATGRWTAGASSAVYRGYHSIAALLPNGTVMLAGGGVPGPVRNSNAEIYYPAYLFRQQGGGSVLAARPRIVSASTATTGFGQAIDVQTGTGDDIAEVSLIAVSSVTHSFDSNQRRMKLAFRKTENGINVTMPNSPNLAPPGYYLMSVINTAGTPSAGFMVAIGAAAPPAPPAAPGQPAAPAALPATADAKIGYDAVTIAAAQDGTVATTNLRKEPWLAPRGGGWVRTAGGRFLDLVPIDANRYYGIGTDQNIFRWGVDRWRLVGHASKALSAASDGTVASISLQDGKVWVKTADDDNLNWQPAPGVVAKAIAVMKRGSLYFIGTDDNVWRSDMVNQPVRIGYKVKSIAASADGTVTVVSADSSIWRKTGDDTGDNWTQLPGTAEKIATPNGGMLIYTDKAGNIYRH